jgi:LacI family transcriptional regulator
VLYNTNESSEEELASIQLARQLYAGGILFATVDNQQRVTRALTESGIPVVGLNAYTSSPFDAVHVSRIGGTYLTTRHLIGLGHRRIAFAGGLPGSMIGQNRRNGFETAMREAGLSLEDGYIFEMGFSQSDGYKAGCYFSALPERPTAICCANDLLALGVMDALNERGIDIPGEVAVTGMDDIPYARTSSPRLTTATNESSAFAAEGVRMLFERIEESHSGEPRVIEIEHELVVRSSSGAPAS